MTAEVAVLNKLAVALAADSAVTIGNGNHAKIYNTVNKIFELSDRQPIGVMIYGGLNFMGLPLEVLIKEYRRKLQDKPLFKTVREAAEAFRDHLETVPYSQSDSVFNVLMIVSNRFDDLAAHTQKRILDSANGGKILRSKFNSALKAEVSSDIKRLAAIDGCASLNRGTERQIDHGLQQLVGRLIDDKLGRFNPAADTKNAVRRWVRLILHRAELSSNRTGVVVAGYGEDEICPTLIAHEMDGIVVGKLKLVETKAIDIARDGVRADALGFAQDDMIEQFLNGVSDDFQSFSDSLWFSALKQFGSAVLDATLPNPAARGAILQHLEANVLPILSQRVHEQIAEFKEQTARQSVVSMVEHMPKQELSNLAEALVDLTSLKRRVSAVRETVGGDVDVALISKSEGFVWVKRKHYFPPELNQRFSSRHYPVQSKGGNVQ